jgi:hypothetical protein
MTAARPNGADRLKLVPWGVDAAGDGAMSALKEWTGNFLMRDNPQLGRVGNVCPFTSFGARHDTLRFGVSDARPGEEKRIRAELMDALDQFDAIPHSRQTGIFRAILIHFPHCGAAEGVATMQRAQRGLRLTGFLRARMLGVFYSDAEEPGLWNPDFRPLRAPIPIIAIRSLVAADAAFVLRHPVLAPAYLFNYPLAGPKELAKVATRRV